MIFNRLNFTELWFTLESNEALGVLDTDYLEDYYGVDGQLTLVNDDTLNEYPVLMSPSNNNTTLSGFIDITSLSNGDYTLKGRVCDVVGNYTVLSGYFEPDAGNVVEYNITMIQSPTYGAVSINGLTLMGGITISTGIENRNSAVSIKISSNELVGVSFLKDVSTVARLEGDSTANVSINKNETLAMRLN